MSCKWICFLRSLLYTYFTVWRCEVKIYLWLLVRHWSHIIVQQAATWPKTVGLTVPRHTTLLPMNRKIVRRWKLEESGRRLRHLHHTECCPQSAVVRPRLRPLILIPNLMTWERPRPQRTPTVSRVSSSAMTERPRDACFTSVRNIGTVAFLSQPIWGTLG